MTNKRFNFLIGIFFSLFIFVLQIVEASIIRSLQNEINLLQFGSSTFSLALESSLLGILSGGLLMLLLSLPTWKNGQATKSSRKKLLTAVSIALLPLLIVLYRLILSYGGTTVSLTQFWGQYKFAVFDWLMYSQIPSFWLGMVVGWAIKGAVKTY